MSIGLGNLRLVTLPAALLLLGGCEQLLRPAVPAGHRIETTVESPPELPDAGTGTVEPVPLPRPRLTLESIPVVEPDDLLGRMRNGFSLPTHSDPSIDAEVRWYASHPEYLDRVFDRGERYLHYILDSLDGRGMPMELALLPIVESAYDPFAYSYGRASGLWQIIPETGRRLGLKQNWWYDGRRDPVDSTRAALDYLEALHDQFDGDWLLAVAAYNAGEGNVARARRRAADAGESTDFWGIRRYLPPQTRAYVPRLLALVSLVADPPAWSISLPLLADAPYFQPVETDGQIDMALAAELAGIDIDQLYELNAGVNRWATDPDGPNRLLVPADRAADFERALGGLDVSDRVEWTRHRVRPGETLSDLASRYQTTIDVLRQVNDLNGNTIRAGDYLMIPHALQTLDAYTESVDERRARQVDRERSGERRRHVVKSGESLWSIARLYGIGVRELASWNAMATGDVLSVGRELTIWTDAEVAPTDVAVAIDAASRVRKLSYVVRRGDSLYSIADRFRVRLSELLDWNDVSTDDFLQPGQRLVLYVDVTKQST
jgi:peptidoglycan lytic transglycosylase D